MSRERPWASYSALAGLLGDPAGVGEEGERVGQAVLALLLGPLAGEFAQAVAELLVARCPGVGGERLGGRFAGPVELAGLAEEYGRLGGDHGVAPRVVVHRPTRRRR